MRIAAHSSPVTYAGQKSAKTPYFVEKKCLPALPHAPRGISSAGKSVASAMRLPLTLHRARGAWYVRLHGVRPDEQ